MSRGCFLRISLAALLLFAALLAPQARPAAAAPAALPSLLLTLDGIKGDFADPGYKDAIVLDSLAGELTDIGSSGKGPTGKPGQEVQLKKKADSASLPLLQALATGRAIQDGYLYFQSGSARNATYMIIHLTQIHVTSYGISAAANQSDPTESITLQAESVLYKYTSTKPGGAPGTTLTWPDDSGVHTAYRFDPITATTAKGYTYTAGFKVTLSTEGEGSDGAVTRYRINGGSWIEYAGPFEIYAADTHTLEYYSSADTGQAETINMMDFDSGVFTGSESTSE